MDQQLKQLIDDVHTLLGELGFQSRWAKIELRHVLGSRIVEDPGYKRRKVGSATFVRELAKSVNCSTRTLYYSIKFYTKFPDLSLFPSGKDIFWSRIIAEYLTNPNKKKRIKEEVLNAQCPHCGRFFVFDK